ncbi:MULTISPECIES: helix-turn-helix domain-containing protein [Microbacterium]|jgi:transcriptional regulator with XRE-family HTH domain|uniref:helix-turn-helix domain-containing protein n=1 Tax=Microbacterium TaxID=33882 RepID=UPI0006FE0601|nr:MULTISPECIES: XRE family transcriptional regulator [unclassified Microbacterium]MBN9197086.1 helix-turn-helix transcriptional regulator [Microbacterium ginsengisoli]MCK9916921.1 XRE family transcriptional regulator [Microbacteriaceae bacterium K1510]KQR91245.1 hypothetical protein ASF93_07810 [Microbacterium sp. Leaf347]KQS01239.1 hypothetical protein ASG00_10635 [Microbacterium sp. Leaf351]ODU79184.1 MAG: hypothetical protein ABT08_02130 [Microbacterium sp. SCN 71-21]
MAKDVAAPTSSPVDEVTVALGERIRAMRHARRLTLVELASASELSHPFLSQLERGLTRPSMGSLERIARALGTSQVELLSVDRPATTGDEVDVVRADEGSSGAYAEGIARMLVSDPRSFHPMEFRAENVEFGDFFDHDEDEWMFVLDGTVEIDLDREGRPDVLAPGDSVFYAGGTRHRWRSADGRAYRLIIVKEHPARL